MMEIIQQETKTMCDFTIITSKKLKSESHLNKNIVQNISA